MGLSLSADAFTSVFPFHLAFDGDLRIVQAGPSLLQLCPEAGIGTSLGSFCRIERPSAVATFEEIGINHRQVFVLACNEGRLRLRGQMLPVPESGLVMFLCSPWLASPAEMRSLGLTLNDFAAHDQVVDFLQVVQSNVIAMTDLKELAGRLAEQRKALTSANETLERQFQELQTAQALTRSILETSQDGFLVTAPDGRSISFNRRFLEMWDIPGELEDENAPGVLREYARKLVKDPDGFSKGILALLAAPEVDSHDVVHLVDGRVYDRYSKPQRTGDEVVGRVWTYRDITEQWRAQEELRLSEEGYRMGAEGASDGILTVDASGRILFATEVCECIFGYSREELRGKLLTDLMPPELRELHRRALGRYLQPGSRELNGQVLAVPGLRKDGSQVQLELSFGEAVVEGKLRFTSIVRDVTERGKTARALEESEKQYRSVVNNIQEVVFQTDNTGRWTFLNQAWIQLRGEAAAACMGKRPGKYIHREDREGALRVFRSLMRGEMEEARHTLRFLRADGGVRWVEVVARTLVDGGGTTLGTTGMLTDITDRREWEQRLENSRSAAETANLAKTEFLATLSHEIRTPLNAIVGMSELMADTAMTEEQNDYQSTVRASAESLLHLIDDLLDVSRIEAGKIDVFVAPFDPGEVCEDAISIVQSRAKQKNLGLYLWQTRALPPFVIGDRNRVRQILINLLTNAIKFTTEGQVTLELDWTIEPDELVDLALRVRDTGPGIAEGDRERIFGKFVQLGPASRLSRGTGLGLAISRSLATAMGAEIGVESTPGSGSMFTLGMTLPRAAKRPVEELLFLERCESQAVLVLAQPRSEWVLRAMLGAWGLHPEFRSDAAEAAKRLREKRFALFVADAALDWQQDGAKELGGALAEASLTRILLLPRQGSNAWEWSERFSEAQILEAPVMPSRIQRALRRAMGEAESLVAPVHLPLTGNAAGRRLLVAEDNPENQRLIRRILEGAGYQVDVASDGATAVEMAAAFHYDAILMDFHMPVLDGFEATAAIRRGEGSGDKVPVIALTAHALPEYRERSLAAGMDGYLTKPVLREHLLNMLREKIDTRPLVLAVDDDPFMLQVYRAHVKSTGEWRLITASGAAEAVEMFDHNSVALLLVDVELGASNGLDVARHVLSAARTPVPVVAVSGRTGEDIARLARTAGCVDRLEKPFRRETLLETMRRYAPHAAHMQVADCVEVDPNLADLIPEFLKDIRATAAKMSGLAGRGDLEAVRRLAHQVKGSGGGYNFHTVTAMGRAIEASAIAGDGAGAGRVIALLEKYVSTVQWKPRAARG